MIYTKLILKVITSRKNLGITITLIIHATNRYVDGFKSSTTGNLQWFFNTLNLTFLENFENILIFFTSFNYK